MNILQQTPEEGTGKGKHQLSCHDTTSQPEQCTISVPQFCSISVCGSENVPRILITGVSYIRFTTYAIPKRKKDSPHINLTT